MSKEKKTLPVVLMPTDSPKRDLEWKIALAARLATHGFRTVIGTKGYINKVHKGSKNCIWLGRFFSNDSRMPSDLSLMDNFEKNNTHVFFLHDEGALYIKRFYENTVLRIYPVEHFSKAFFKKIFFWGERQKDVVLKVEPNLRSKSIVTGFPRFEYIKSMPTIDNKDTVLFCTRFAGFNIGLTDPNPLGKRLREILKRDCPVDTTAYQFELWGKVGEDFIQFIKMIQSVCHAYPDKKIIIRPHPGENFKFYLDVFSDYPNVSVEFLGDVRSLIAKSAIVIASECTTGFEALLMKKPLINFVTTTNNDLNVEGLDSIGQVCTNSDQVIKILDMLFKQELSNNGQDFGNFGSLVNDINQSSMGIIENELCDFTYSNNIKSTIKLPGYFSLFFRQLAYDLNKKTRLLHKDPGYHLNDLDSLIDMLEEKHSFKIESKGFDHIIIS